MRHLNSTEIRMYINVIWHGFKYISWVLCEIENENVVIRKTNTKSLYRYANREKGITV